MLRQTLARSIPRRSVLSSSAAPATLMASMTTLRTAAAAASASSSLTVASGRPSAAAGSLRLYSIDITRRTDFADKGPISYDEVKELTQTPGKAYIIDVREREEILQGNIPSSLPLPLSRLSEALKMDAAEFEKEFTFAKPAPDQPIVVYCRSGKRSASAKEMMESLPPREKFTNIRNYSGSWLDWSAKDVPKVDEDDD